MWKLLCVKTLSHKTTEPSCGSLISLYNHVCGLRKFSASASTGARGGRRQHRGKLTGAGGTLDGVSSPHSAFSKVAGKSIFQFWTDLDQTWYTYWGSQKRTAHQLWRKSDNSKRPSAVKGKNDQGELSRWWPYLQDICIYALYMFPENLKIIQWKIKKLWRIMWSADGHSLYINVKSYDRMFLRYRQVQAKDVNKSLLDLS